MLGICCMQDESKYKKLWVLEAILAGSGVGKSRLGIETIEAILRELEKNPESIKRFWNGATTQCQQKIN